MISRIDAPRRHEVTMKTIQEQLLRVFVSSWPMMPLVTRLLLKAGRSRGRRISP
jgi:hypothetical protein